MIINRSHPDPKGKRLIINQVEIIIFPLLELGAFRC